ncbi:Pga45 protein [Candida orthopsilosis Co 90-125]|uniref:Pga45 protein n=1 Tax=Candida orthopsilosis (strain 90-125) TaxID=1136231 RepID=H8X1F7_CANO9|nr:Pga45 protein [Candida orthopsilosis Co 90-125]CCG22197.1 Pga45 protein [Candida orthopsilosis Co 90-125]
MYLTNIFITLFCLFTSLVHCIPTSPIPQGAELSIREELDQLVESNWDSNDASLYYDLIDMFSDEDLLHKREDDDDNLQNTINYVLEKLNSSGIIWELLDAIADHPERIDYLANLTSSLLGGMNITINVGDILSGDSALSSLTQFINVTAIVDAVMDSGLVTSLADGLLLDSNFRPRLADIINRVVWSQRDVLLYIFGSVFQKRDHLFRRAEVDDQDISVWSSLLRAAEGEVSGSTTTTSSATANPSSFTIDPNVLSSILNLNSQVAQTQSSSSSTQRATSSASRATSSASRATSSASRSTNSALVASASSALSALASPSTTRSSSSNSSTTSSSSRAVATTTSSRSTSSSSSEYSGSLGEFVENAAGTVLGSNIVGTVATDVLNALNDTGFAVYFVKRFLSDDAYVNMTAALANSLLSSGTISIDLSSVNVTSLIDQVLGDPSTIIGAVSGLLSGNSSALSGTLGKYSGAIQSLIGDIEATGLFARLNNYIFGDSSSSSTATQTSPTQTSARSTSSSARREVVSASATTTSKSSVEKKLETSVVASVSPTNSAVSRSSNSSNDASGVAGNAFTMKALFFTQAVLLIGVFAF